MNDERQRSWESLYKAQRDCHERIERAHRRLMYQTIAAAALVGLTVFLVVVC